MTTQQAIPMRFFEISAQGPQFAKAVKKIKECGGQYDGSVKVWGVRPHPSDVPTLDACGIYGLREISRDEYKARRAALVG